MTFHPLHLAHLRAQFPALTRQHRGRPVIFADAPGGTQVPQMVSDAMSSYLATSNANFGGRFATSRETNAMVAEVRTGIAQLLHAPSANDIIFGQNMTSLTFAMSRALAREWHAGDEIIVTALDHDANVSPWVMAAADRGVTVHTLPFQPETMTLDLDAFTRLLTARTRLVALTCASNAVGSIIDVSPFIAAAHQVGALVYLDAVHFAPHGLIDVQLLDCDFLACSAYKFCGPHIGILYGRQALLESLTAYKVRPASSVPPGKWETGTQNTEALAGLGACLDYISNLGGPTDTFNHSVRSRSTLTSGMQWVVAHEQKLSHHFLNGAAAIPGLKVHGIADPGRTSERTPTFGLTLAGIHPRDACERLAERGIWSWDGHFYAQGVIAQLGLAEHGGLLRIGFAHYTTIDEVETVLESLRQL